jgi:hypothetical protein
LGQDKVAYRRSASLPGISIKVAEVIEGEMWCLLTNYFVTPNRRRSRVGLWVLQYGAIAAGLEFSRIIINEYLKLTLNLASNMINRMTCSLQSLKNMM